MNKEDILFNGRLYTVYNPGEILRSSNGKVIDQLRDGSTIIQTRNIFQYIGEYCPDLRTENNAFLVGSEDELKMVLFGIEQRFYTTPVGDEKRIANSVILMK